MVSTHRIKIVSEKRARGKRTREMERETGNVVSLCACVCDNQSISELRECWTERTEELKRR